MTERRSLGLDLVLAGRRIEGADDMIRRYCGQRWSGGKPETWAFAYYDAVDTALADRIDPVDVLAAGALQRGLSREDMTWFSAGSSVDRPMGVIAEWLVDTGRDATLGTANAKTLGRLEQLATWEGTPGLALLTKVLHRKRPDLVPLIDRATLDWYRPITGHRRGDEAWPGLLRGLRDDLSPTGVNGGSVLALAMLKVEIAAATGRWLSLLRLVDIAIWMDTHR